jgi:hypothetical protein
MGKTGKNSKNNPDVKTKQKQNKIVSSVDCERCKDRENCKEFKDYEVRIQKKLVGRGVTCKRNK